MFLFALFHDSMRFNDNHDPLHGLRGAELAKQLRGETFDLEDAEMGLLAFACEEHTNGGVSSNPTVGCAGMPTVEPVAGGCQAGPSVALNGGGEQRGAYRVGAWFAAGALRLGGTVSGLRASMVC